MNLFSSVTCRREFILNYFGEKIDRSRTDFHVCCDICRRQQEEEEASGEGSSSSLSSLALKEIQYCNFTTEAELFLQCLVELGDRQGVGKIIKMIRGSNDKTMSNRCKMSRYHGEITKGLNSGKGSQLASKRNASRQEFQSTRKW